MTTMTKEKIIKELYPELDEYWIGWLMRKENKEHPKKKIVDKVYNLILKKEK